MRRSSCPQCVLQTGNLPHQVRWVQYILAFCSSPEAHSIFENPPRVHASPAHDHPPSLLLKSLHLCDPLFLCRLTFLFSSPHLLFRLEAPCCPSPSSSSSHPSSSTSEHAVHHLLHLSTALHRFRQSPKRDRGTVEGIPGQDARGRGGAGGSRLAALASHRSDDVADIVEEGVLCVRVCVRGRPSKSEFR